MTTIYTKPQIDAMAVKIGGEIKAAKTTVTQSQGQSTTYAVSQKMITDSLSAFGTAATRNVGTEAGNVMEVGAFGLGGVNAQYLLPDGSNERTLKTGFYEANSSWDNPSYYGSIIRNGANNNEWLSDIFFPADETLPPSYRTSINGRAFSSWKTIVVSGLPSQGIQTESIQAGIGAPKIAYKKLTGVTATGNGVPHGLDASKILSISFSYLNGGIYWPSTPKWDATEIDIKAISSGFSYKLLITYEV